MKDTEGMMDCSVHGKTPWEGTVVCAEDEGGCGRVWHLANENDPLYPPAELGDKCRCGKALGAEEESPARAICGPCFEALAPSMNAS